MLEGDINQINLIERLVALWREQFTGAIRFENDGIIKIIYFKGGDVLSASTNDRGDSIDEILMRAGKVSREHVKQALARRKESETLGDAMLNLGYITRKELTWARRVQVVGVIRSIAAWTEGSFTIVADYLPKRDEGTLFPLPQILVELIVTEQERQKFDRALEGGSVVFEKSGDFSEVFGRLGLNEDAEAIIAQVDGTRTAAEVASSSGRDAFNVYKLLHALATLGILANRAKPQVTSELLPDDDFAAIGASDAADVWDYDTPEFQLDEGEALVPSSPEISPLTFDADETAAMASPVFSGSSAWKEPEEVPGETPAGEPESSMPAWSTPVTTVAVPIPGRVDPAVEPAEQWGFDEAQLETVERASTPSPAPAPIPSPVYRTAAPVRGKAAKGKGGGRKGLIIALVTVLVVAAAGYGGFLWWQQRGAGTVAAPPAPPVAAAAPQVKPETGTVADIPPASSPVTGTAESTTMAASTATESLGTTATTESTATVPAPVAQPLPAVTPRSGARIPIEEQARTYAANPQGNFTVQIQILCDPANVEKAVRAGGGNVWFVPQTLGSRSCYRIFWGRFDTREEARTAMGGVPQALRDPSAAVRPVPKP